MLFGDKLDASEDLVAAAIRGADAGEALEAVGFYTATLYGPDGEEKWSESFPNLVTTLGKNNLLDAALSGASYTAAFYLGLVDGGSTPSYSAGDTMGSHAGWTENQSYSNSTRPAMTFNSAAGGSKASQAANFSISASATIAGCFVTTGSAKGGTAGTQISGGNFSAGSRGVLAGDTLAVTYTLSI